MLRADHKPFDIQHWDKLRRQIKDAVTQTDRFEAEDELDRAYSCGIYAVKEERQSDVLRGYHPAVFGEVALWGRIAQFTLGYRAEYCMIKSLRLLDNYVETYDSRRAGTDRNWDELANALSSTYQCDVSIERKR